MADKGLLFDFERKGNTFYMLSPPVIGFLEYTFMKRNEHLPMKQLAELADSYLEHHLAREVAGSETPRVRVVPYEGAFAEMTTEVVTYEQAREIIKAAGHGSLQTCYCRREAHLLGRGCDVPVEDSCMGLGPGADYLVRHGFARPAAVDELLEKLVQTEELGLAHTTDNVQEKAVYMCHCCGCCCHILGGITKLHLPNAVAPSGFIASVDEDECVGCGKCEERCQIDAVSVGGNDVATVNTELCIGCGVCVPMCPTEAMTLKKRESKPEPPRDLVDLHMRIAQEKDRLKHFM